MSQQPSPDKTQDKTQLRALVIHHVVTALLVGGALALAVWSYLTFKKRDFFYEASGQVSALEAQLELSQRERISLAIKTYYQLHNNWPLSLEQLVEEGLLESSDLRYPSPQVAYTLRVEDGRPILEARRDSPSPAAQATP